MNDHILALELGKLNLEKIDLIIKNQKLTDILNNLILLKDDSIKLNKFIDKIIDKKE